MIISFGKTGGSGAATADYMTADRDHQGKERENVQVLRGDPQLTGRIADDLDFKRTYSAGIIAWAVEEGPTPEEISDVLDRFENLAFAGLEKDQYSWAAVQHDEASGSKHLHFIIAGVDLDSGKKFNPAPPGHRNAFDALRDSIIFAKGWADPNDKARSRLSHDGFLSHLPDERNPKKAIANYLAEQVERGLIKNRDDVIKSLGELGKITRQGESYISVKPSGFTKTLRLKGDLYERKFNAGTYAKVAKQEPTGSGRGGAIDLERHKEAIDRLQRHIKSRTKFNHQRYRASVSRPVEMDDVSRFHNLADHLREHLGADGILHRSGDKPTPRKRKVGTDREYLGRQNGGVEFRSVQWASMCSNRRKRKRVQRRVSDNEEKTIDDGIRNKLNKLAQSFAERVRRIRRKIEEFFVENDKSNRSNEQAIEHFAKEQQQAIKHFTREQQRASDSHRAIAKNSKEIAQQRSSGLSR